MHKHLRSLVPCFAMALAAAACGGSTPPTETPAPEAEPAATTPEAPAAETPAEAPPEEAKPAPAPEPPKAPEPSITVKDVGFNAPESVLYDDQADIYLVSNINGVPSDVDGNGFISKVSPDGKLLELKWIDGTKKGTKLNAPKGMALVGPLLYVADIDTVRMFDRKTGKAKGEVKLKGATFANDITAGPDGKIYVSDSGMKLSATGMEPTKTDAVWVIEKKKAKALAQSEELGKPNGLLFAADKLWVTTFGSGELYSLDAKGVRGDVQKLPKGALDGIVAAGDSVLISSWEGTGIFKGTPGGEWALAFPNISSPADIGFDSKRNRLLVPVMTEGTVLGYDQP
jgi:glucose/arabinose dehydrogenase